MKRAENFEHADIVDILGNIQSLKSYSSGIASRWSIWHLHLIPSKYFQCIGDVRKNVNKVFMKVSLTPNAFKVLYPELDIVDEKFVNESLKVLEGLRYERKVCLSVVTDLIDSGTCIHFRKYYSNSGKLPVSDFHRHASIRQLKRELYYLASNLRNKPRIESKVEEEEKVVERLPYRFVSDLKLNCLITDDRFITSLLTILDKRWMATSDFYLALFQVCYTCYCLNRAGVAHNNVNWATVLIERLKQPVALGYNVDGIQYVFENANVMVVLENFEQSYCKALGINQATDKNNIVGIRDFVFFLKMCSKDSDLLHLIGITERDFKKISATYRHYTVSTMPIEPFLDPEITYPDVLNNIYIAYKSRSKDEVVKPVSGSGLQVFYSSKFIDQ